MTLRILLLSILLAFGFQSASLAQKPPSEFDKKILATKPILQNAQVSNYVADILRRLNKGRDRNADPVTLTIIDDKTPNAFTTGNGYIYVFTGLLRILENEAQLAMVLGHELAHGDLKHIDKKRRAAATAAALAQKGFGVGSKIIARGGFAAFGRMQERFADLQGLKYLAAAGYKTSEGVQAFGQLKKATKERIAPGMWLKSHPMSTERLFVLSRLARRSPGGSRIGQLEHRQALALLN